MKAGYQHTRSFQPLTSYFQLLSSGFTLIEIVLVAAVLAVLMAASVPRFHETAQRLRAEQTAFSLAQLLRYARERAISQGEVVIWHWDAATRRVKLNAVDGKDPLQWPQDCNEEGLSIFPPIRISNVPEAFQVTLLRENTQAECVHFYPDGSSTPSSVHLLWGELEYAIIVDATTSQVTLHTRPVTR
ncbi:MAG: prepilin-type N-terminal cleavage/methylation domain-containing protein [Candidatus Omnitrophica bacterium]|nr:prepilin-type N-terminal cleavage/methylation domain-containing protein [Candidatus Omnitrophota bacterium]MBI2173854.1 prepilin-type N-terminal cleavage/methylation domain-containing protein [Candidatus Omnitrophota bacterium]MBI3009411.1 prepilin-type N-terminal cleavage/methylation domain-containing protein [Candidatus Omnitrophota bacterium]